MPQHPNGQQNAYGAQRGERRAKQRLPAFLRGAGGRFFGGAPGFFLGLLAGGLLLGGTPTALRVGFDVFKHVAAVYVRPHLRIEQAVKAGGIVSDL